jgi:DNA-binding Lrp family transcriptional regulator
MFLIPVTEYITTLYLSNTIREILPTAYVLVLCDYSYPDYEIMSQLSRLPCITEVNRVDGPYDIIVKLSDNNMDTIKECIGKHMTRINGIQSTLTLMAE